MFHLLRVVEEFRFKMSFSKTLLRDWTIGVAHINGFTATVDMEDFG